MEKQDEEKLRGRSGEQVAQKSRNSCAVIDQDCEMHRNS